MKILIGNPNSVDDGYGDESFGYSKEDEDDFIFYSSDPPLLKDVERIVQAYKNNGYLLEPKYAYYAWDCYSQSLQASWLIMCDDDKSIIMLTRRFLVEKEDSI